MQTRDANSRDFLIGIIVGFALLLVLVHLGGCATASSREPVYVITQTSPAERGPIVIRVRIVDTDPSDDVGLSFVYLCSRVVRLMRGEPVEVLP